MGSATKGTTERVSADGLGSLERAGAFRAPAVAAVVASLTACGNSVDEDIFTPVRPSVGEVSLADGRTGGMTPFTLSVRGAEDASSGYRVRGVTTAFSSEGDVREVNLSVSADEARSMFGTTLPIAAPIVPADGGRKDDVPVVNVNLRGQGEGVEPSEGDGRDGTLTLTVQSNRVLGDFDVLIDVSLGADVGSTRRLAGSFSTELAVECDLEQALVEQGSLICEEVLGTIADEG